MCVPEILVNLAEDSGDSGSGSPFHPVERQFGSRQYTHRNIGHADSGKPRSPGAEVGRDQLVADFGRTRGDGAE